MVIELKNDDSCSDSNAKAPFTKKGAVLVLFG